MRMFDLFQRRKQKSEPEKISPAQGPGSQSKDKYTSDSNPTISFDAPQPLACALRPVLRLRDLSKLPATLPLDDVLNPRAWTVIVNDERLDSLGIPHREREAIAALLRNSVSIWLCEWADESACIICLESAPGSGNRISAKVAILAYIKARSWMHSEVYKARDAASRGDERKTWKH